MALGGTIKHGQRTVEAKLLLAYAGGTRFAVTRWKYCHHRWWVLDYLNQGLIGLSVFRVKSGDLIAEIVSVELRVRADFSGEKTFAQGTEGNKTDSKLFERRQHRGFGISPPERVFAL